jgi:hypothetical protein
MELRDVGFSSILLELRDNGVSSTVGVAGRWGFFNSVGVEGQWRFFDYVGVGCRMVSSTVTINRAKQWRGDDGTVDVELLGKLESKILVAGNWFDCWFKGVSIGLD